MTASHPSQSGKQPSDRGARIKRSFVQSTYITAAWTWFLVLAGKAAEPILVVSVLYASLKLLPIVHFAPQLDAVVFVAQFIALDVGGLSLNKLADQALREGNAVGAKRAKYLSIALVSVMLAGVILAGVDQIVRLDTQIGTIIDTILLIARAIMAVLYSRVIHALKEDEKQEGGNQEVKELFMEAVTSLTVKIKTDQMEQAERLCAQITASTNKIQVQIKDSQCEILRSLSQWRDQHLSLLNEQQDRVLGKIKEQQEQALAELPMEMLTEAVLRHIETALAHATGTGSGTRPIEPDKTPVISWGRKLRGTGRPGTSRSGTTGNEVDTVVWPLLALGKTVRGIETETGITKATVGRSRLRWVAAHRRVSETKDLSHQTPAEETPTEKSGKEGGS